MKRRAATSVLAADLNGLENHPGRQEKKDRAVRKNMSVASTLVAVCAIATMLSYQGQKTMAAEGPADTAHAGPELVIGQTGKAPQIDGVLDDRAWEDAARVEYLDSISAKAPREKTQAWVACDKEHLYFAFKCHESQMDKLAVKQTEINELLISLDDCIEIFLTPPTDPPPPAGSYYQLMINANGIFYASSPYNGTRWKPDIKVGAKRLPDSWILEVSITFQSLNRGSPSAGEVWSVNIGREQKTHGVNLLSAFSPVGGNFHTPELFGTFRFEKKTPRRVGNYSFGGRVITENGPLEDARVVIGQQVAFTNSSGDFTIDHLPTGAQTLSVTKSGFRPVYKPVVRQIELNTNQVAKEPFLVETVMVTAYGFNWSLGAVAAEKNYQIYFNHVNTPVAPGTRLSEDQTAEQHDMTLETVATLDSYEPVTFTIFSNEELGECTVSVGDMVCAEDPSQRIKAATADVRVVQVWIPPVELGGSGAYRPEILKPLTAVDIGPKTFRQFWITYHIPPDTRGGLYQGDITFRPANKAKTVLRSEMTVFPFRLQKSKDKQFGVFYLGGGGKSGVFNMDKKKSDYRGDFIDMHQHGVDGLVFPGEPAFKRAPDGTIAIDFELVDHALDVLKEIGWKDVFLVMNFSPMNRNLSYVTGITGDDINAGNLTEEHITALKEVITGINKRVRERGFETPYYMWYDEITALGHVEFWVNMAKVFKPISDGERALSRYCIPHPRNTLT